MLCTLHAGTAFLKLTLYLKTVRLGPADRQRLQFLLRSASLGADKIGLRLYALERNAQGDPGRGIGLPIQPKQREL